MRGERDATGAPTESASPQGEPSERSAEYRLVMPVELWFGEHHVGVRPGTPTCEAFQRLANALLAELKAARHGAPR